MSLRQLMAGVTEYLVTLLKTPPFNHFCHSHLSVAQMRIQSDHSFTTSTLQLKLGRVPSRRVKLCPLLEDMVPSYPTRLVLNHLYKSIPDQAVRLPSRFALLYLNRIRCLYIVVISQGENHESRSHYQIPIQVR